MALVGKVGTWVGTPAAFFSWCHALLLAHLERVLLAKLLHAYVDEYSKVTASTPIVCIAYVYVHTPLPIQGL